MKKSKDLNIFLEHILENIEKIDNDFLELSEVEFSKNVMLQDATLRRLEVIGEAVKNLPLSFRKKYPMIPWKKMAGMRDVLIHEYFGVDMELVWKISIKDIPRLKKQILKIVK
jgi:uncharacterized protein with HEPN domain